MKLTSYLLLLIVGIVLTACGTADANLSEERQAVQLGEQTIYLAEIKHEGSDVSYINVHEDEYTSVEATRQVLKERGGQLTVIEHTGDRRIEFVIDADTFSVDPNRIFTDSGIQKTLEDGNNYSEEAHRQVSNFAEQLLYTYGFDDQRVVVAMHNNRLNGFSIESYAEDGRHESAAEDVYINPDRDINDFFYVTDATFFDYLSVEGYNVILQDNDEVTDDGSLSVYSGFHDKPYINIEAGHGHHDMQIEMIEVVLRMFEELGY